MSRRRDGPIRRGSLHPSIEAMGQIAEIFGQFGFVVYESPEIEDDLTNFQMLNIPPDHPARDLWDTLYLDVEGRLLRTHTSPGQIHVMRSTQPPIRALLPGRCFRYEAIDASHATGVLPGRGPDGRRGHDDGRPQGPARPVRPGDVRRRQEDALPARLLPVHGAVGRLRHRMPGVRRVGLSGLRADGLDDDPRGRHGPPGRAPVRRPRP